MTDNALLLERIKDGDESARDELVKNNMKLVGSIAARFTGRGYDWEDLSQIGAMGLLKAIDKFDLSYGVMFSTYAVPVIMGEIKRFLRDDGMIKISRSIKETAAKGKKYAENLCAKLGREPTTSEIAKESGIDEEELMEAFDAVMPVDTLTAFDSEGKEQEIKIADTEFSEENIINKIFVSDMLTSLPKRERQIIALRYFKGKTQSETAKLIGVSQVQISRLEKNIINKLKAKFSG